MALETLVVIQTRLALPLRLLALLSTPQIRSNKIKTVSLEWHHRLLQRMRNRAIATAPSPLTTPPPVLNLKSERSAAKMLLSAELNKSPSPTTLLPAPMAMNRNLLPFPAPLPPPLLLPLKVELNPNVIPSPPRHLALHTRLWMVQRAVLLVASMAKS